MTFFTVLMTIINVMLWLSGAGIVLALCWVAWVYVNDLQSHSEQMEIDEKRMIESLKAGKGVRSSETGGNHD